MSWSLGPPSILSLGIYKFQGWLYGDNNQLGYITAKPLWFTDNREFLVEKHSVKVGETMCLGITRYVTLNIFNLKTQVFKSLPILKIKV